MNEGNIKKEDFVIAGAAEGSGLLNWDLIHS
jgi:hypothetical protein